jgi:isopentenyl-diphosphate delta-isomerase
MGACLGGMAGPFLKAAALSLEETVQAIAELQREIQVCMFAAGAGDLQTLASLPLVERKT